MRSATNAWAPTIAASNARRIQRFGMNRGVEPSRLGDLSLSGDRLDARVPAGRMFALWEQLSAALDRSVSIQVAETSTLEDLQLLGFTLTTAPTVEDGLSAFLRYSPLLSDAFGWSLSNVGSSVEIRWQCRVAVGRGVQLSLESSMAQVVQGIRQLAGADVDPLRVNIGHVAPAQVAAYRAFFRCPIEFDTGFYRVRFSRHVLEAVPRQANRALWSYLCAQADQLVHQLSPQPLEARVRGEVSRCLADGRSPKLRELADRLGMSERSLRRQLATDAIGFRRMVDQERRELARELLSKPGMSITRAALDLGFADSSALAHACQRWFSRSPSELKS
jgi:AraC-like DNA-binding protein